MRLEFCERDMRPGMSSLRSEYSERKRTRVEETSRRGWEVLSMLKIVDHSCAWSSRLRRDCGRVLWAMCRVSAVEAMMEMLRTRERMRRMKFSDMWGSEEWRAAGLATAMVEWGGGSGQRRDSM